MKFKTTRKAVNNGYSNRICIGYCDSCFLLKYRNPTAYTNRREGWGADVYEITPNIAIITGYAPFGNIKPNYEIVHKYNKLAGVAITSKKLDSEQQREQVEKLLNEFIEVVLNDETKK